MNIEERKESISSNEVTDNTETITEENNTNDDVETTSEENIEPPVISEEITNTTTKTNRPKPTIRPVERLHPCATHLNNHISLDIFHSVNHTCVI